MSASIRLGLLLGSSAIAIIAASFAIAQGPPPQSTAAAEPALPATPSPPSLLFHFFK
jgi:hypothetical protein